MSWDGADQDRLLLVFTTSCPACKKNQDTWRGIHSKLNGALEVVGVSLDDAEVTRSYRDNFALPFEVVVAADREEFASIFEIEAVPTTLHMGRDGRVLGAWRGVLSAKQVKEIESGAQRRLKRS